VAESDWSDSVASHHRFPDVYFQGQRWELEHLDAFAIRHDPGLGFLIDVVILFSCHCFTRSFEEDGRDLWLIPAQEIYDDGRERRVLCLYRYSLSRQFFPRLIQELRTRTIFLAPPGENFLTYEVIKDGQVEGYYVVFFEPEKDSKRKKRILLRVQSAYFVEALTKRQRQAGKVTFDSLMKATYLRRKIRG
jgi:hypothetical protein